MTKSGWRPRRAGRESEIEKVEEMVTAARCWYRRTVRSGTDDESSWCGQVKVVEVEVEV